MRVQAVSIRRRATSSGPPAAMRRAIVHLTVGVIVLAGTQEIEGEVSTSSVRKSLNSSKGLDFARNLFELLFWQRKNRRFLC